MTKNNTEKSVFMCTDCGGEHMKWCGQCEFCKEWNTLKEIKLSATPKNTSARTAQRIEHSNTNKKTLTSPKKPLESDLVRYTTNISEFDRVLGGGFFPGSITLLTGDPGIGKSTLSLHACLELAKRYPDKKIVLVSGEESEAQISDRIFRLIPTPPKNLFLISEGIIEHSLEALGDITEVGFLLFDSIQTLSSVHVPSAPGSITQTVAVTEKIMLLAKQENIPTLIVGHVTKTGEMAGPQTLAHLVDTVLHFEGEDFSEYRILRSKKNRFGSVFEMGVFEMTQTGLHEINNPSQSFLSGRLKNALGSAVFPAMEGTRPLLMEIQALTKYTSFGYPKRSTSGFSANRLAILLAVLQRFTGAQLDNEDVFVNIVGGLKISEPAADLAVVAALISSKTKKPLLGTTVFCGEIGLSGEIRQVSRLEQRLKEAEKLGFKKAIIPVQRKKIKTDLEVIEIRTVGELEGVMG